jgi:hypothetical protein
VPTMHLGRHLVSRHDIAACLSGVFVKLPRSGPPTTALQCCAGASIKVPRKHSDGKEINSYA